MYNSIMFPWEEEEEEEEGEEDDGWGETRSGVPCQVDLYTPPGRGGRRGANGKMSCGRSRVEGMVGGISGVGLTDVDRHVFTEVTWSSGNRMLLTSDVWCYTLSQTGIVFDGGGNVLCW